MRKCFTINPHRSASDIKMYEKQLVQTKLYAGCEIFYPYMTSDEQRKNYQKALQSYLQYHDLEMVLHLPYGKDNNIATYHNLNEVMERLKKAIDFAREFKVTKLTLHPGEEDQSLIRSEAIALSVKNIQILCDYAKQYGMIIMIENLVGKHELCLTTEEIQNHLVLVNRDNCKFILDCGHYNVANHHQDLKDVVYTMQKELVHLHISNNDGTTDQHASFEKGNIDFVKYFQYLKDINYQGLFCSEILFNSCDELIKTAETLEKINNVGGK